MPGMFGMWPGIIGAGLQSAGRAAWKSPYGKSAIIGGGLGGIYGGFSDNTSIMGGMFKGAALGAGARGAYGMGRAGMGMYNMARGMGMGSGQAAWRAVSGIGRGSAAFIGSTAARAYNPIRSTLKGFLPRIAPTG